MNQWASYIGICVEDKEFTSRVLKVHLRELLPFVEGEVEDDDSVEAYSYIDDESGNVVDGEITVSNHITAEWFGMSSNRVFPPDVVLGEQVLVMKYSDEDIYYWVSLGRDDNMRRLEILRHAVSDSVEYDRLLDDDNTYYVEMDTKFTKRIRIVTSKSDGEDYRYEIIIDAKNNFLALHDDAGNEIIIESDIPRIKLKNANGTIVDLNGEDIIMIAPRDVVISADRQIVMSARNVTIDAKEAIKSTAINVGIEASHVSIDSPTVGMTGNLQVLKDINTTLLCSTASNTGDIGAGFPLTEIDIEAGIGTTNSPAPIPAVGTGLRQAAASESIVAMAQVILDMFNLIDGHEGIDLTGKDEILTLATESAMSKNKGE